MMFYDFFNFSKSFIVVRVYRFKNISFNNVIIKCCIKIVVRNKIRIFGFIFI